MEGVDLPMQVERRRVPILAAPMALVADVAKIGALRLFGNVSIVDATRYAHDRNAK